MRAKSSLAWVDGWIDEGRGKRLKLWKVNGGRLELEQAGGEALRMPRVYDPGAAQTRFVSESMRFEIAQFGDIERLIKPGHLTTKLVPGLRCNNHAVTVIRADRGIIYVPMLLWIQELWMRSLTWVKAILTPQALDINVPIVEETAEHFLCRASPLFVGARLSEDKLRRIAWLAINRDARKSWNSVLTFAHDGRLDMKLPPARISGWVWGQRVDTGIVACELRAVEMDFELPSRDIVIQVGARRYVCPKTVTRRNTPLNFD